MSDDEEMRATFESFDGRDTSLPMGRAHVVVLEGRHAGRRFPVDGTTTIGRGDTAQIRVDDPVVSRLHAVLRMDGSEWQLEDLGSHNGTLLNGVPVGTHPIRFGDRVQIGTTLLLFAVRDPLEEQIRHRQKLEMLGRLGAGVAHDMNNLLASVLANAELVRTLVTESQRTTEIGECLADIVTATRQGAALTPPVRCGTPSIPTFIATIPV